jgi:hypothetical protein
MGVVDDIIRMQQVMASDRVQWEQAWRDCVNVAMPTASHLYDYGGTGAVSRSAATDLTGLANAPKSIQRGRELYDSTAAWATDRLTAGMESLITPRAQKWHALALDDPFAPEPSDLEEEWLDYLRDYLFGARYDTKANFSLANQKALRNTTVLGTGVVYSDENLGRRGIDPVKVPFFYKSVPLIESYLAIDAFDDVDKVIRVSEWTARSAAAYFKEVGGTISAKLQEKADDPARADKPVAIIHAVCPRAESGEYRDKRRDSPYASFWIEVDTKHLIKASGYFSFPYSVTWWDQTDGSAYGQSPVMQMLADIKMLQVMNKAAIQAAQQAVKPPLATMEGVYRERPNLNSGATNPGYLDTGGNLKIKPIITSPNPTLAERIIEAKRMSVQTGLYVTLFQILVENPQMSATEALIRANEKGELLGPAGAKIESGIAQRIDREIDIVGRKGAFEQASPLAPPPSMIGRNVGVKFTGPLARLRRVQELQGVQTVLGIAGAIAEYDPSVLQRIDADETLEISREIGGAPRKMFRTDEEVAALREQAAQDLERRAALEATEKIAGAAGKAAPAMKMITDAQQGRRAA